MKCPKCGFANPGNTPDCPQCGIIYANYNPNEKHTAPSPPDLEKEGEETFLSINDFIFGLFDLSFSRLIAPSYAQAVYAVNLIVGGIAAILFCIYTAVMATDMVHALLIIATTMLSYFVLIVLSRVGAEFMIIAFKIERNTRKK